MTSHEYILSLTKNIVPSYRYDYKEDFTAWQKRAKEKLSDLLGLPLTMPSEDKYTVVEEYEKFGLSSLEDLPVSDEPELEDEDILEIEEDDVLEGQITF